MKMKISLMDSKRYQSQWWNQTQIIFWRQRFFIYKKKHPLISLFGENNEYYFSKSETTLVFKIISLAFPLFIY